MKIKELEDKLNDVDNLIIQENKNYETKEYKLKERIYQEEIYLKDAMSEKAIMEKEYKAVESENENIYNLTKEKLNLTERAIMNVSTTLKSLNTSYYKRQDEFQKLITMKISRNFNKRATSVKKTTIYQKSKNSSFFSNAGKTTRSSLRFSVFNRNELSKESLLNNLKKNEEIKEEEEKNEKIKKRKSKIKRKSNLGDTGINQNIKNSENKTSKHFYKTRSANQILYFEKNNDK